MKVLLISPLPPPYGGIANWTILMLDYVKNTDDTFTTINIAPKKRTTEGRSLFDRIVVSGFDMLKKNRELKKEIKSNRPDVIHMTTSGSLAIVRDVLLLKTAKKYHIPTVYHIRFGKTEEMAKSNSKMWKLFSKAMEISDIVVAIDKRTYSAVKQYVPKAKVALAPNPIDITKLPDVVAETKKQIVFLGWVVPTKGVTELVEAWNTVGKEYPDYQLVIIGQAKPDYLNELKKKASVENINFAGEMSHDEAMKTVAKSQIFVLPSYTEGFPNSVVEAMSLKKPIIATGVGAIPEMLDNECGVLIEPKDSSEIVNALKRLLNDSEYQNKIANNAYEKVINSYTIDNVYNLYKEIWNSIKDDEL